MRSQWAGTVAWMEESVMRMKFSLGNVMERANM